ncbi:MAG: hypothetical protein BWY59_00074 [Verrucomicrobia bacterium ADurb.Bin345]|nr:MAG: hypothetical protein BWY59_00074 [Verrucomicrobia bacterium ADurb.Bin345]
MTDASRSNSPSSKSCNAVSVVSVFDSEPIINTVLLSTGRLSSTSANPKCPIHAIWSPSTSATETPLMSNRAMYPVTTERVTAMVLVSEYARRLPEALLMAPTER